MSMLTPYQQELIHREIDGENTPDESIEVQKLLETEPDAAQLMTGLQSLNALFSEVPDRAPHPRVKVAIYNAMSSSSRKVQEPKQSFVSWATQQWSGFTNLIGESMLTKKVFIGATTIVAAIAIIGYAVVDYKPSVTDAGTVGAGDGMSGVQQAGRYKNQATEADITLSNPEIQVLLQDDKVLKLLKSDVFRELMHDDAFRRVLSSEAFHQLEASHAFQDLMSSEAYQQLMAKPAYQQLMGNDAYQQLMAKQEFREVMLFAKGNLDRDNVSRDNVSRDNVNRDNVNRDQLMASAAYREVMANAAFRDLMSSQLFREVMSNQAFRDVMSNQAFRDVMSNQAFREVMSNQAFRDVMSSQAFREVMANQAFRVMSQDVSLSDAFLNRVFHAEQ